MAKRVLVVTSCTGEKKYKPHNQLLFDDLQNPNIKDQKEQALAGYKTEAVELYTGGQHVDLMKGVSAYRAAGLDVDIAILSAGYGVLHEKQSIYPYEVTFNDMTGNTIQSWSKQLAITETMQERIENYDLIFFLLGDKYLQSIEWPLKIRDNQKLIFFAGESSKKRIQFQKGHHMMAIGTKEAKEFGSGLIRIKGHLFSQLLTFLMEHPDVSWDHIYDQPELARTAILELNAFNNQLAIFESPTVDNLLPFSTYCPPFDVEEDLIARNYQTEFKFFIPENDDRVDPNYVFENDYSDSRRDRLLGDRYAHELYNNNPNYDGVLISKTNIDKATQRKRQLISEMGIRNFLRLPENTPIMGDCGAFSYIEQDAPPYTTQQVLDYYHELGYDYGVSVDHLIVGPWERDEQARQHRYRLTLDNAREFIQMHAAGNYNFTPVGIAQGWDPDSFANAVAELKVMGYQHFAIGGLAREKSEKIFEILKKIAPLMDNPNFRMHLFGVARDEEIMKSFHKLGVTSFDSASPLRRAWLGTGHNFHALDGTHYTAIRIPEAKETAGRVKKQIAEHGGVFEEFKQLETVALKYLREYDAGQRDLDSTLEAILAYDTLLGENRDVHRELYRKVLEERPWEACGCQICQTVGIDVIIFRGNNRNRRRGFHNTYVYYERLKRVKAELFGN
ncbi:tRNA-guanine family transglycosylase [Tumebacillus sp. BK434]|uniref:tRNA-guanine transglycosylase DpdA n=1 Tax=Tumebacillus sp. BK434 TaxID=2512169 RepID=UPI0010502BA5|nr:tRNA-guanine transglycosylase DpdA [Tumebacillus sp. BK434]TCP53887.1 tRNA-guanine family transglycosylase [Tumebacillus sp. BK434]